MVAAPTSPIDWTGYTQAGQAPMIQGGFDLTTGQTTAATPDPNWNITPDAANAQAGQNFSPMQAAQNTWANNNGLMSLAAQFPGMASGGGPIQQLTLQAQQAQKAGFGDGTPASYITEMYGSNATLQTAPDGTLFVQGASTNGGPALGHDFGFGGGNDLMGILGVLSIAGGGLLDMAGGFGGLFGGTSAAADVGGSVGLDAFGAGVGAGGSFGVGAAGTAGAGALTGGADALTSQVGNAANMVSASVGSQGVDLGGGLGSVMNGTPAVGSDLTAQGVSQIASTVGGAASGGASGISGTGEVPPPTNLFTTPSSGLSMGASGVDANGNPLPVDINGNTLQPYSGTSNSLLQALSQPGVVSSGISALTQLLGSNSINNAANNAVNASTPINQPQRTQYQNLLASMQTPAGMQQWMASDPFVQALLKSYSTQIIPAQYSKSGNMGAVVASAETAAAPQIAQEYQSQVSNLLTAGGFTQGASPAASTGLLTNAYSSMYALNAAGTFAGNAGSALWNSITA